MLFFDIILIFMWGSKFVFWSMILVILVVYDIVDVWLRVLSCYIYVIKEKILL